MSLLRHAKPDDIPALRDLIAQSGRDLSAPYYTSEQIQAITRRIFGVDSQLIEDQAGKGAGKGDILGRKRGPEKGTF